MTVTGAPGDLAPTTMFAALADDTRWRILTRLGEAPASASALARELPVSRQAIVKHLEVLRGAGLVEAETVGRELVHRALGGRLAAWRATWTASRRRGTGG